MKQSTKAKIAGFTFFFVGSMFVQQFIDPLLYVGLIFLGISWMFMDAQLDLERSEKSLEQMRKLHENIEASLDKMKKFTDSDKTEKDEAEYFDKKRSES